MFLLLAVAETAGAGVARGQIEQQLDDVELQAMADTFQDALENNPTTKASDWVNPDADRSGGVVPIRTFENTQGQPCREFITNIIIAGQEEQGYGTACRQPDGSWQLARDITRSAAPAPPQVRTYFVEPPPVYYAYPRGFYGPTRIYLSFGYVFRSGKRYRGSRYLDGFSFRHRHPVRVINHRFLGPRFFKRFRLEDELNYRDWERRRAHRHVKQRRWRRERHEERHEERYEKRHEKRHEGHRGGHRRGHH